MEEKENKRKEKRLVIKTFICLIYLIVMTVLFVCSYKLFQEKNKIIPWSEVESVNSYTYIDISKMSGKFAYYKENNVGIHFVIEEEDTGLWHTYLIAIDENDIGKYQSIIDYTYERTDKKPDPIRVYGYPVIVDDNMKEMAIKNIANFVPAENEIKITNDNYEKYLTNSYLDTTQEEKEEFSILLLISLMLLLFVAILFVMTIFDKDKIVNNIDESLKNK